MKKLVFILLLTIVASCGKQKDVELPAAKTATTTDMVDYSAAYLFFNPEEKDSLELNRNNLITSTNWVLHIDKRLPLYALIPKVKMLQDKKANAKMHKNENAKNYFSVNSNKQLAFVDFTTTTYKFDNEFSKFYIEDNREEYLKKTPFTINFDKDDKITLNGTEADRETLAQFIDEFANFASNNGSAILYLNFDKHLSFQQYITDLQLAQTAETDLIKISPIQFIYDEDKLPDCGCTL